MASRSDLNGMLRTEEGNFQQLLMEWAPTIVANQVRVRARFKGVGSSTEEAVAELTISRFAPNGAANVIDDLERQIIRQLGPNPDGTLRLIAYEEGKSGTPAVNMQRRVVPAVGNEDPNQALLRYLFKEERAKNNVLEAEALEDRRTMRVLIGEFAKQNAGLATMRATGTAAADAGGFGLWHLVGFLGLLAALPSIKRQLGLPKDAPLQQVISRALMMFEKYGELRAKPPKGAMRDVVGEHEEEAIRAELEDLTEPDDDDEAPPPPKAKKKPKQLSDDEIAERDSEQLLVLMKKKPELMQRLVARVKGDDELMAAFMAAM